MPGVSGRGSIAVALVLSLALAGVASAAMQTASFGGVSAKLSYSGGIGPTIRNLRLTIHQGGALWYDEAISSRYCLGVHGCSPASPHAVHVAYLEGNGAIEVVVDLFSGGADCCNIEQVFTPSAALGDTYFVTERNFGPDGAKLEALSHGADRELVSGDPAFYCRFTACYASGLPIQIFGFAALTFTNITRRYPAAIVRDAARWWAAYRRHETGGPSGGEGVLAAWAADEELLGNGSRVATTLASQVAAGHITSGFVTALHAFLRRHGY
jgi:hypothetical protein